MAKENLEKNPIQKQETSHINGSEKSVIDQLVDDLKDGVINEEEYTARYLKEIERRQKMMSTYKKS